MRPRGGRHDPDAAQGLNADEPRMSTPPQRRVSTSGENGLFIVFGKDLSATSLIQPGEELPGHLSSPGDDGKEPIGQLDFVVIAAAPGFLCYVGHD